MRLIFIVAVLFNAITIPVLSQERNFCLDQPLPRELKISRCTLVKDSAAAVVHAAKIRNSLIENGFLAASVDSMFWQEDTVVAIVRPGAKYTWAVLSAGNVSDEFLTQTNFRPRLYSHKPFNPRQVSALFKKILSYAENSGYPFARLRLDSLNWQQHTLEAALNLDLGAPVKIDTVIIRGSLQGNRQYILHYLNLEQGQLYDHRNIIRTDTRLKEIPFVQPLQPHDLAMTPGKAAVYLYLDKKKASNFSGILGLLPEEETGKVTITGDVELNLMNALRRGETINFHWQKLPSKTQQLNLSVAYPYVLNLPVGVEATLDLYRQDTVMSQVKSLVGLQYLLSGGNKLRVFVRNESTNILSSEFILTGDYRDSKTTMAGIGSFFSDLDYRFNPRRGYQVSAEFAAGKKKIVKDPAVEDEVYGDSKLISDIYELAFQGKGFIPLFDRATIMGRVQSGYLINDDMYKNDLLRIGGLKLLRGFNEQSIYASFYSVATIELRYILEQNSNVFLFFDQGYYENKLTQNTLSDNPYGFGGGVNFETTAGIFSFTYALGQQLDTPVDLRSGKVHFGFVSLF